VAGSAKPCWCWATAPNTWPRRTTAAQAHSHFANEPLAVVKLASVMEASMSRPRCTPGIFGKWRRELVALADLPGGNPPVDEDGREMVQRVIEGADRKQPERGNTRQVVDEGYRPSSIGVLDANGRPHDQQPALKVLYDDAQKHFMSAAGANTSSRAWHSGRGAPPSSRSTHRTDR
jgi:hypothetical protein